MWLKDKHKKRNGLPLVFLNLSGKGKITNLYPHWHNALKRLGLEGHKFHDFRRSAAIRMTNLGIWDGTIMDIVGWGDPNTLRRYRIVDLKDTRMALKKQDELLKSDT